MMLIIKQKDINIKLQNICLAVDSKSPADTTDKILDCVYFEIEPESITITASSSNIQSKARILGKYSGESYKFAVNARNLSEIVRNLPSLLDIQFQLEEKAVEIICGTNRFSLPNLIGYSGMDYPILELQDQKKLFDIDAQLFHRALQSVSFSMGSHHLRFFLAGCHIKVANNNIKFIATDTHRLSQFLIPVKKDSQANVEGSVILPRKSVLYIERLLSTVGGNENLVETYLANEDFLVMKCGDYQVVTKLIVGAYPETEQLFQQENAKVAVASTQLLKESLLRTAVLATDKFKTVRFGFDRDRLTINSKSMMNETGMSELEIQYDGQPVTFNFNAGYLIDLVNRYNEQTANISMTDENGSVIFSFKENDFFKYVIMPLRY